MFGKIKSWFKKLPEHKTYLELITGLLTIPVLLTVILLNFASIMNRNEKPQNTPPTPPTPIIIEERESPSPASTQTPQAIVTPTPEVCKKEVGPVSIVFPKEGEEVSNNPVNFVIRYEDSSYCSVVWSYRINSGPWSEFSSNSPVIYNLPGGAVKFELRVQSTASSDQELLVRNFTYTGSIQRTPVPTP